MALEPLAITRLYGGMTGRASLSWWLVIGFLAGGLGAADLGSVPGPESDNLLRKTTGFILRNEAPDSIVALQLPSLKTSVVLPPGKGRQEDPGTIHTLSGPDSEGRIVYVEDHFFVPDDKRRHVLKTIRINGKDGAQVFSRPGSVMWAKSAAGNGEMGEHLALSHQRGQVAFLSGLKSVQMPDAYLFTGRIEVWKLKEKTGKSIGVTALDEGLSWFPDGGKLAYVRFADPEELDKLPGKPGGGGSFQNWPQVPVVCVRDMAARTESMLHVGWRPVVSADGSVVLMSDNNGRVTEVETATGKARVVSWPGLIYPGTIALPKKDVVLSWALPTDSGKPIRRPAKRSPLGGPMQMQTLKLVRPAGNEFQTVLPEIDPRSQVSFGMVDN